MLEWDVAGRLHPAVQALVYEGSADVLDENMV